MMGEHTMTPDELQQARTVAALTSGMAGRRHIHQLSDVEATTIIETGRLRGMKPADALRDYGRFAATSQLPWEAHK